MVIGVLVFIGGWYLVCNCVMVVVYYVIDYIKSVVVVYLVDLI